MIFSGRLGHLKEKNIVPVAETALGHFHCGHRPEGVETKAQLSSDIPWEDARLEMGDSLRSRVV